MAETTACEVSKIVLVLTHDQKQFFIRAIGSQQEVVELRFDIGFLPAFRRHVDKFFEWALRHAPPESGLNALNADEPKASLP